MPQVVVEMTSDEGRLFRGTARLMAQQRKVEAGFKDIRHTGKDAGEKVIKVRIVPIVADPSCELHCAGAASGCTCT